MSAKTRTKIIWSVCSVVGLVISFILSRYVFDYLHGMKSWPVNLFVFGLIVMAIAVLLDLRVTMICIGAGNLIGFFIGMILNPKGVDGGGISISYGWAVWTIVFIVIIVIGIALDIIVRYKSKKNPMHEAIV